MSGQRYKPTRYAPLQVTGYLRYPFSVYLHNPDTCLFTQDPVALEILEQLAGGQTAHGAETSVSG